MEHYFNQGSISYGYFRFAFILISEGYLSRESVTGNGPQIEVNKVNANV